MIPEKPHPTQAHTAQSCPRCGVIDVPTLSPGTPPHACKASCAHCGKFLRWVSVLAPAERMARRMKERLRAMQQRPPSAAQLDYLRALGDTQAAPTDMAEASQRINQIRTKGGRP
jgi:phage FluMu protein Com